MKYIIILIPVLLLAFNADVDECSDGILQTPPVTKYYQAPPSARQISIVWQTGDPVPTPTCRGASGVIGDKIYVFGGQPDPRGVHYEYDIAAGTWNTTPAADPNAASNIKGVVYNGELYVLGGYDPAHAVFRKYNPGTNSWTTLTSPPGYTVIYKYGVGVVNDKIYYYCGRWNAIQTHTLCWEYDPAGDSWTQKTDLPGPGRSYFTSAASDSFCYAFGGNSASGTLSDGWRYNAYTDTWEATDSYPIPTIFGDADFIQNVLISAGGGGGYGPWPAENSVYDWIDGSGWTATDVLPAAVGIPHNELANYGGYDYIFCFGGYNGTYVNSNYIGTISGVGIAEQEEYMNEGMSLTVWPNMIRDRAMIQFQIPTRSHVSIQIYDVSGRVVSRITDAHYTAGDHEVGFDSSPLAAGVYVVDLQTETYHLTNKLVKVSK